MTQETEFSIRDTADQVVLLLEQQRSREAFELLNRERADQSKVIQEALDRFVLSGAEARLGALNQVDAVTFREDVSRIQSSRAHPRFPGADEMEALASTTQRYDVYASIVAVRGDQTAIDAMQRTDERVILGLRQENNTMASMRTRQIDGQDVIEESPVRSGQGIYDDRIVLLWKDGQGEPHVRAFDRSNTEPTAQYDHHAGADGVHRRFNNNAIAPRLDASDGYEGVSHPRKIEGSDANQDGVRDLGRIAEGTIEMQPATHPNPRSANDQRAFRPARDYPDGAERDTNADGWFTAQDTRGVQNLDSSFKIHSGSMNNTDSAGCQTIHPHDYREFMDAARGNAEQTRWQYVLVDTSPGMFRDVNRNAAPNEAPPHGQRRDGVPDVQPLHAPQQHAPQMLAPPGRGVPGQDAPNQGDNPRAPAPQRGAQLMTDPDHIANATWLQAERAMSRAGIGLDERFTPEQRERASAGVVAGVLADTRTNMSRIDRVDASTFTDSQTGLPKYLIAGQGDPTTAHYKRVAVDISDALNTSVERSSDVAKTAAQTREQLQVQQIAQAQTVNQDSPSGPSMRIGARSIAMSDG